MVDLIIGMAYGDRISYSKVLGGPSWLGHGPI